MKVIKLGSKNFLYINLISILFLIVQGCSNQQLGKQLSENFESSEELFSKDRSNREIAKSLDKENFKVKDSVSEIKPKINKESIKKTKQSKSSSKKNKFNQFKSQNYLVIIKIFGANPSAPGENLTNALRSEGVEFEVQKIEKIENKGDKKSLNFLD